MGRNLRFVSLGRMSDRPVRSLSHIPQTTTKFEAEFVCCYRFGRLWPLNGRNEEEKSQPLLTMSLFISFYFILFYFFWVVVVVDFPRNVVERRTCFLLLPFRLSRQSCLGGPAHSPGLSTFAYIDFDVFPVFFFLYTRRTI